MNISCQDKIILISLTLGGEVIRGKLIVELRKKIVLNAIRLQLKGRAASINDPSKADVEKVWIFRLMASYKALVISS